MLSTVGNEKNLVDVQLQKKLQAHHEQLSLCTNRLAYRQGRKFTAVKVYTINSESNHLLLFGVPSLKLRQEAKSLFLQFGKLIHFTISPDHPGEEFTETYHARYEQVQSARIAKRVIDMRNFYGGTLHVCYAPEFETIDETRSKLSQRVKNVENRLRNLKTESREETNDDSSLNSCQNQDGFATDKMSSFEINKCKKKINMGDTNIIYLNKKRKSKDVVTEKIFKPCFENNDLNTNVVKCTKDRKMPNIDIVDCTSVEKEVVSNISEALNYNKFGNEVIKTVEKKPLNRIIFNCNKNA